MQQIFKESKQEITFFSTNRLDFPAHIHEDIELVYVRRGHGTAYCDGTPYTLKDGAIFLTFPNQVHHYIDSYGGSYILLIVKPNDYDLLYKGRPLSSMCRTADAHTVTLLEMALKEYEINGSSTVVDAILTAFFEKLLTFYQIERVTASTNTVTRILHYCNEHYREEITLAGIAEELHISKSAISHTFSDRLGISFYEHIHTLRLNNAESLLRGNEYSITEIAELSGFATIRTFNRVFRRHFGMSPSAYRKSLH